MSWVKYCIANCSILKGSLMWQCVSSYAFCVQVATRMSRHVQLWNKEIWIQDVQISCKCVDKSPLSWVPWLLYTTCDQNTIKKYEQETSPVRLAELNGVLFQDLHSIHDLIGNCVTCCLSAKTDQLELECIFKPTMTRWDLAHREI